MKRENRIKSQYFQNIAQNVLVASLFAALGAWSSRRFELLIACILFVIAAVMTLAPWPLARIAKHLRKLTRLEFK